MSKSSPKNYWFIKILGQDLFDPKSSEMEILYKDICRHCLWKLWKIEIICLELYGSNCKQVWKYSFNHLYYFDKFELTSGQFSLYLQAENTLCLSIFNKKLVFCGLLWKFWFSTNFWVILQIFKHIQFFWAQLSSYWVKQIAKLSSSFYPSQLHPMVG